MMTEEDTTLRVYGETYDKLKEIKRDDESVVDVIRRITPEDVDRVLEHPEAEAVGVLVPENVRSKVDKMAGENVSANDVVQHYIDKMEENQDD